MPEEKPVLTEKIIIQALHRAGLVSGDVVMFHSSLSKLGHIRGGERTVFRALKEVVGRTGTIVVPVFTYSGNKEPFHPHKSRAQTGRIPEFFRHQPGVFRSKSPTHSVAAWGRLARSLTRGHAQVNPYDRRSPFGKLYDHQAKVVFFGCQLYANSMLHAVEDWDGCPYLVTGKIKYYDRGRIRVKTYHKLPPGHRDFYQQSDHYTAKIYRALYRRKLIREVKAGQGYIRVMPAVGMVDACRDLLRQDPNIFLCDQPSCEFCRKYAVSSKRDLVK